MMFRYNSSLAVVIVTLSWSAFAVRSQTHPFWYATVYKASPYKVWTYKASLYKVLAYKAKFSRTKNLINSKVHTTSELQNILID
jgi:hypothetical protein